MVDAGDFGGGSPGWGVALGLGVPTHPANPEIGQGSGRRQRADRICSPGGLGAGGGYRGFGSGGGTFKRDLLKSPTG